MASLDTQIQITAVDRTREAFASVQSSLSSLSGAVGALPGFAGIAASLAAFASAGAIKTLVADTISWAASMDDMAERTGATVEQLSSLAAQAKISGTDMATVEQGIIRLNNALAGGDDETKGAARALAAIGLESENLRRLDPAEAYRQVAEALGKFADGGGKTAVAMAILGKSAAQQLPFMKDLAEAGRLNAKVTTEQAAAAEQLEKAWARVSAEGGGFAKGIALSLIPTLASLIDYVSYTKMALVQIGSSLAVVANDIWTFSSIPKALATGGIDAVKTLLQQRKNFLDAANEDATNRLTQYKSLRAEIDKTLAGGDSSNLPKLNFTSKDDAEKSKKTASAKVKDDPQAGFLASIRERITLAQAELEADGKLSEARKFRVDAEARLGEIIRKNPGISRETGQALINEAVAVLDLVDAKKQDERISEGAARRQEAAFDAAYRAARGAEAETKAMVDRNAELGLSADEFLRLKQARIDEEIVALRRLPVLNDELTANSEIAEQIKDQIKALEGRKAALEDGLRASQSWAAGVRDAMNQYIDVTASAANQSRTFFTNAFKSIEDGIVQLVKNGKVDFASLADSIISDLVRIQAQENITKPLAKMLGNGGGGIDVTGTFLDKMLFGGGSWFANGGIMSPTGALPLNKYAGGGIATSPQLAVFGEGSMNEAFVPLPDGRSIPVQMRGGGGGVSVSMPVTIDARGASAEVVPLIQQSMQQVLAQMRREVPALVQRQQLRNGATPFRA